MRIVGRFMSDRCVLPLTWADFSQYRRISRLYWRVFGRFADLRQCPTLNDKIQWLKLFDRFAGAPLMVDKIRVKDYVTQKVPGLKVPRTLGVYDRPCAIEWDALPSRFVVKTNHDSGSVYVVHDKERVNIDAIQSKLAQALQTKFGVRRGEWAYDEVRPAILVEELLGDGARALPDYKFYCVNGRVRFLHYIYDRDVGAKEQLIDQDGTDIGQPLHPKFPYGSDFKKPHKWNEMIALAEQAASGVRFVRVDLYLVGDEVYFGEYTFWPGSGVYQGPAALTLSARLDFDRTINASRH